MPDSYLDAAFAALAGGNTPTTNSNSIAPPPENHPDLPVRGTNGAPAATWNSGPSVVDPELQKQFPNAQFIGRGRQTLFGLNYNGSIDEQDNGIGFFRDPSTSRPYDTRNDKLIGASLNTGLFNGTIGNRLDPNIQKAVSQGRYKVQLTLDNGKSMTMPMVDIGPAGWTGNAVDITKGAADQLGIKDNSILNYQIIGPDGKPMPLKNAPPVPIAANPSGETRGTQYARQAAQRASEYAQYYGPNVRVASQDEVDKWDYAVQNNLINPNDYSEDTRLAVALAKDPQFLLHPENKGLFKHFVTDPEMQKGFADHMADFLGGLPAAGASFLKSAQDTVNEIGFTASEYGKMLWNGFSNSQVKTDPGRLATDISSGTAGVTKAYADVKNMLDGVPVAVDGLARPLVESFIQNPNEREQIDQKYSDELQTTLRNQWNAAQMAKGAQQKVADGFRMLGATSVADALQNASPNQSQVGAVSMVTNPLNIIPFGEGVNAAKAVVPSFFEKMLAAGEDQAARSLEAASARTAAITPDGGLSAISRKPLPNPIDLTEPISSADVTKAIGQKGADAAQAEQTAQQAVADYAKVTAVVDKYLNEPDGLLESAASRTAELAGKGVSLVGKGLGSMLKFPEYIANRLFPSSPEVANRVAEGVRWGQEGAIDAMVGEGSVGKALIGGPLAYTALRISPEGLKGLGSFLQSAGKELLYAKATTPYWQRVAQSLTGLPRALAMGLDNPLVHALPNMAKGGVSGFLAGSAMGAASNPIDPIGGLLSGGSQGGIFGMVGGGFGQIQRYNNPAEFMAEMRGDWKRYRDALTTPDRASFDSLSSTDQLALSQFSHKFPGMKVNYFNDPTAEWGSHFGDTIHVNTAIPGSAIRGTIAHEFSHEIAERGQLPDLYRELLGEPNTKTPGQYTLLDSSAPDGVAHVDPNTGRYQTNAEFGNLKNEYVRKLADKKLPTDRIDDFDIAKEIFAEHGVDYMLSGDAIADAHSAFRPGWFHNQYAHKQALMAMGAAFDMGGGAIRGTGLFSNLERNPHLQDLLRTYTTEKFKAGSVSSRGEDVADRAFTKADLQANPDLVDYWFNGSSKVARDASGKVVKDATGTPIILSDGEAKKYNVGLARDVDSYIQSLSEDQRAGLGYQKDGNGYTLRYMPDDLINKLAAKNQYNPTQLEHLRSLSKSLVDQSQNGRQWKFFYNTATKDRKYATLGGAEKIATPYLLGVNTHDGLYFKGVDFAQLTNNFLRYKNNPMIKKLWGGEPNLFHEDAKTYFQNHAQGKAGAEGIGQEKRDVINALTGIGASGVEANKEMNPFVSQTPRARSIIKSYRVDRTNRLAPTDSYQPFNGESQYQRYLKPNYLPGGGLEGPAIKKGPQTQESLSTKISPGDQKGGTVKESLPPAVAAATKKLKKGS